MIISETIEALERIKTKYGDLQVYNVYYGSVVELEEIEPIITKTSLSEDYIVIFEYKDEN